MEALIYDESPLADILEDDAIPFQHQPPSTPSSHEHEHQHEHQHQQTHYAPHGLPRLRDPIRFIKQKARLVRDASEERFLERFRYTIIASQLLVQESEPRRRDVTDPDRPGTAIPFSLRGAYLTATFSFSLAWLLSWLRLRWTSARASTWSEILLFVIVATTLVISLTFTARRQYLKFIRQAALFAASTLVDELQNFDSSINVALRYVQEVEVVARGYDISHPLPPVTRLDDKHANRHCRELRITIAKSLIAGIGQFVHFHNELQSFIDTRDLHTYYHIYELSLDNLTETIAYANDLSEEAQETLKQLRFHFELHNFARRVFLADLLAVRANPSWSDVPRWRKVIQIVQTIAEDKVQSSQSLQQALRHEEDFTFGVSSSESNDDFVANLKEEIVTSPERDRSMAQMRRFETLVHGIRSLNAKTKLARDEVTALISTDAGEAVLSSNFARHYDMMGSELRSLLLDWERGRTTMLLIGESDTRCSRPSSGPRSPISPSPSLGGVTMVDGGPAEALRLLTGDGDTSSTEVSGLDEEVFEAVAKPRKRMSLALSREQKIAKLQEGRRKRATLQEQSETTTNMLRELQMVIKHRPTPSKPNNRITSI